MPNQFWSRQAQGQPPKSCALCAISSLPTPNPGLKYCVCCFVCLLLLLFLPAAAIQQSSLCKIFAFSQYLLAPNLYGIQHPTGSLRSCQQVVYLNLYAESLQAIRHTCCLYTHAPAIAM